MHMCSWVLFVGVGNGVRDCVCVCLCMSVHASEISPLNSVELTISNLPSLYKYLFVFCSLVNG